MKFKGVGLAAKFNKLLFKFDLQQSPGKSTTAFKMINERWP